MSAGDLEAFKGKYKCSFSKDCQLGKGGCGTVYKAEHIASGQFFAVKKSSLQDGPFAEREIQLLAILSHPNLVRYVEYYAGKEVADSREYYIVLEYAEEGDLASFVTNNFPGGKLPENVVRSISYQIASGLQYLHHVSLNHLLHFVSLCDEQDSSSRLYIILCSSPLSRDLPFIVI